MAALHGGKESHTLLGHDPGGAGANGVALLHWTRDGVERAEAATLDTVDEVLAWFRERAGVHAPMAAGIDSCLTWSTGRAGWRPMDIQLRTAYPAAKQSVVASNSAFGAMTVQGMAAAMLLRKTWPAIVLNETHPKVLYFHLRRRKHAFKKDGDAMRRWLRREAGLPKSLRIRNDHEWDALLSAWATGQGLSEAWSTDLMAGVTGLLTPAGPVRYYWPASPG